MTSRDRSAAPPQDAAVQPALRVERLRAWYRPDRPVLDLPLLEVPAGKVVGLLGLNGAGKTTLLTSLCTVHEQVSVGRVSVEGVPVAGLADPRLVRRRYAVFTDSRGFGAWTFTRYAAFLARVYGTPLRPELVEHLVDGFGFAPWRDRRIADLSTGNRKKVFLIAGLALRLPLLLLDEPTDGLDFRSTEFLYDALGELRGQGAVLMSSHVAESFERCCDLVLVLEDGALRGPYDVRDVPDVRRLAGRG